MPELQGKILIQEEECKYPSFPHHTHPQKCFYPKFSNCLLPVDVLSPALSLGLKARIKAWIKARQEYSHYDLSKVVF